MRALLLVPALLLAACGADDPTDGDATLSFGVTNGVRNNPTLEDALIGDIYGQIFLSEEVTVTGPVEGATEFGSVELLDVDLEAGTESEPWTTPKLAPGSYVFLGFFDVDANGAETREPDDGDPVTLPVTNVFEVTAGETVELDAVFDLVLN
jgi:hypothetical protein